MHLTFDLNARSIDDFSVLIDGLTALVADYEARRVGTADGMARLVGLLEKFNDDDDEGG